MQLSFLSHSLNAPTLETFREYGARRFENLSKFLPKFDGEHMVKISVHKERFWYIVSVEIMIPEKLIIKVRHEDLRAAIDNAYSIAKRSLTRYKEKKMSRKR